MNQDASHPFSIVLKSVPEGDGERTRMFSRFSSAFHLKQDLVRTLFECVPVVLFSEQSRDQVSNVKPLLKSLSEEFDVEFLVTSAPVSALSELNWPEQPVPEITDEGKVFGGVELEVRDGALVCPECDHILVLNRSENRISGTKLTDVDESQPPQQPEDGQGRREEGEPASSSTSTSAEGKGAGDGSPDERNTRRKKPEEEKGTKRQGSDEASEDPQDGAGGKANVFISGIPEAHAEEVLQTLTEVRNCSPSEAKELMERPVTPIRNGVSEEKAYEIEERFNEIGVTVNIVYK